MWRGPLGPYFPVFWVKSDYVLDKSYNNSCGHVRMNLLCILQTESARLANVLDGHGGSTGDPSWVFGMRGGG